MGTISPTDPERWPFSGGGEGFRGGPAFVEGESGPMVKTLRQAGLGQRIDLPRSSGCT
jgi:hypothetical protein